MPTLPNMGLITPTLGADPGVWDDKINAMCGLIDAHDHTAGKGLRITPAAMNINADVAFGGNGATGVGKVAFTAVTALTSGLKTLFVNTADGELYWRTAGGANVKLTAGSSINTTLVGGIVGDYTAVSAQVAYDSANTRYTFKGASPNLYWAITASGEVRAYPSGTNSNFYVGMKANAALAASYAVTWPLALPGAQVAMQMDAAGNIVASNIFATPPHFSGQETLHISACDAQGGGSGATVPLFAANANGWTIGTSTGRLAYPLRLPRDAQINGWRIVIRKISAAGTITGQLYKYDAASTTETPVGAAATYAGSSGYTLLSIAGLTENISTQSVSYYLVLTGGGTTGDAAYHAEVDYSRPT